MTSLHRARARLEQAVGLTAIMGAAYDAFEDLLALIREYEDPANGLFAAFMFAAASAANGRDAILFAPSLPPTRICDEFTTLAGADLELSLEDAAVGLGHLLAARLLEVAQEAVNPGDRSACYNAARCAESICGFLRRSGP